MANDVEIKLPGVRLSFFHGFVPQERRNDAKELTGFNYNSAVLIPKDDQVLTKLVKDGMSQAKKNKWGDSAPNLKPEHLCLRDGEPADMDGARKPLYDGYAGMLYVSANRVVKPEEYDLIKAGRKARPVRIIGPRKNPATQKFDELNEHDAYAPYSGCFANVILRIYATDAREGQPARINASLEAVQFVRDGEKFGASPVDVDSAFDEIDAPVDDAGGGGQPVAAGATDEFNIG